MRPTERDLMVARAVRDGLKAAYYSSVHPWHEIDLTTLIQSLPEPADVKGSDKLGGNSEHEQAAQDAVIDCGDNSCIFKPSGAGGMRTNGGCRCYERAGFGASAVGAARKMLPEVLRLRREVSVARREERERCLKIVGDHAKHYLGDEGWLSACVEIADEIRAVQDAGDDALFVAEIRRKADGMNPPNLYADHFARLLDLAEEAIRLRGEAAAAARREGVIEGLEWAVVIAQAIAQRPDPPVVVQIRAEIERLKREQD